MCSEINCAKQCCASWIAALRFCTVKFKIMKGTTHIPTFVKMTLSIVLLCFVMLSAYRDI